MKQRPGRVGKSGRHGPSSSESNRLRKWGIYPELSWVKFSVVHPNSFCPFTPKIDNVVSDLKSLFKQFKPLIKTSQFKPVILCFFAFKPF